MYWPYRRPPGPPLGEAVTLNRESPQAVGLTGWWPALASAGAGGLRDLRRQNTGTLQGTLGWASGVRGPALAFTGSITAFVLLDQVISAGNPNPISFTWTYRATTISATRHWVFSNAYNSTDPHLGLTIEQVSTPTYRMGLYSGGYVYSSNFTLDTNYHDYAVTWATDGTVTFWQDGVSLGTATRSPAGQPGTQAVLGTLDAGVGGFSLDGELTSFATYARVLSPAEVWQLYDSATRWELYQAPRRLWVAAVAATVQYARPSADVSTGGWQRIG